MVFNEDKSSIDRLGKALYSRNLNQSKKTGRLSDVVYDVKEDWNEIESEKYIPESEEIKPRGTDLPKKILFGALIFFVVSVLVTIFVLFGGANTISGNNVDITILGPVSIGGGENLSLDITVVNKNNTTLSSADLVIEFPDGTKQSGNTTSDLKKYRQTLGDISPSAIAKQNVKAILFGEENSKKIIKVGVEYRVTGSSATFYKEKDYEITITSSPVRVTVSSLKEVTANQQITITVDIDSNSTSILNDIMIKAEYPFGFTFKSSNPSSVSEDNTWKLGDLSPKDHRTIKINGTLEGQDNEERTFRFNIGREDKNETSQIGTTFLSSLQTVVIKKPFISVGLSLDGDSSTKEFVAKSGRSISGTIIWANNLPTSVSNVSIEVKLTGQSLDRTSVNAERGFYKSVNNTIVWDKSTVSEFGALSPGENGRFNFSFSSQNISSGSALNPQISVDVSVKGDRTSETNTIESLSSFVSRIVKVASNLKLTSKALYFTGPISNSGPIPPKVDTETTFTIVWTLTNSVNSISGARVTTTLPPYVKFTGILNPTSERITYNEVSGEIAWDAGDVLTGAGSSKPAKEVAFQVSMIPSTTQVGSFPVIINESTVTGDDTFANASVKDTKQALTTILNSDPGYRDGLGLVVN